MKVERVRTEYSLCIDSMPAIASVTLNWSEVLAAIAVAAVKKAGYGMLSADSYDVEGPAEFVQNVAVLRLPLHVDLHDGYSVVRIYLSANSSPVEARQGGR